MNLQSNNDEVWDPALDAVTAAPKSHEVIDEDDERRVLVVRMEPHSKEPLHHHRWPSQFILIKSTELIYTDQDGNRSTVSKKDLPADQPFVEMLEPEPLHSVENPSDEPYLAIRIEFKK